MPVAGPHNSTRGRAGGGLKPSCIPSRPRVRTPRRTSLTSCETSSQHRGAGLCRRRAFLDLATLCRNAAGRSNGRPCFFNTSAKASSASSRKSLASSGEAAAQVVHDRRRGGGVRAGWRRRVRCAPLPAQGYGRAPVRFRFAGARYSYHVCATSI
jgi:hypothetical protein